MKIVLTWIFSLLFSGFLFAQNSINYKALIKDDNGNIVSNTLIVVQFSIIESSVAGTAVYEENHTPNTDENGLIILNIGEGTPTSGVFSTIDWGGDDHFLNVQMNTGGGLMDLGTTQFMAVPYALEAFNVNGLEAIDEGEGVGWRIVGRDPLNFGNIGAEAIDLSYSASASNTYGATAAFSFAVGPRATASGNNAIAMGNNTIASGAGAVSIGVNNDANGSFSFSSGSGNVASGFLSTTIGSNNIASSTGAVSIGTNSTAIGLGSMAIGTEVIATGTNSTAFGRGTRADANLSTAIGRYNVGGGSNSGWIPTDPLFEIGTGSSDTNRSNAVTVLKNGNVGIGNAAPQVRLVVDGSMLLTQQLRLGTAEYFEDGGAFEIAVRGDLRPTDDNTYDIGTSTLRYNDIFATSGTVNTSDRRSKTNIEPSNYGLKEVLQLQAVQYNWKSKPNDTKKIGLIAQDLLQVIPEVVKTYDWQAVNESENAPQVRVELERMGVYYSDLIPVLIKAIQEQQEIITKWESTNINMENRIQRLEALLEN